MAEKVDGHSALASFLGEPEPFTQDEVKASATRHLFRAVNLPLIPDKVEEKLDDLLVDSLVAKSSLRSVFSFIERGGWYSADNFLTWLRQRLDSGTYKGRTRQFSHLTLAQFHAQTHVDLSLIASDTQDELMLVLNHRTAPDVPNKRPGVWPHASNTWSAPAKTTPLAPPPSKTRSYFMGFLACVRWKRIRWLVYMVMVVEAIHKMGVAAAGASNLSTTR